MPSSFGTSKYIPTAVRYQELPVKPVHVVLQDSDNADASPPPDSGLKRSRSIPESPVAAATSTEAEQEPAQKRRQVSTAATPMSPTASLFPLSSLAGLLSAPSPAAAPSQTGAPAAGALLLPRMSCLRLLHPQGSRSLHTSARSIVSFFPIRKLSSD